MATFANRTSSKAALRQSYNLKDTMGLNAQNQLQMILGTNSALFDQSTGNFSQQYVDALGSAKKLDFASSPYYKNYADMESVNKMIQSQLLNPQGETFQGLTGLLEQQGRAYAGGHKEYARFAGQSKKRAFPDLTSQMPPQSDTAPVGMPVAQGYESTPYETAARQMIPQQMSDYYAMQGGLSTADQPIPNATYLRDAVSGNLARQGGNSFPQLSPANKNGSDLPELQIRNESAFPIPKRQAYPLYNNPYTTNIR